MPPRKGFFIRLAATLIDAILLALLLFPVGWLQLTDPGLLPTCAADVLTVLIGLAYTSLEIFAAGTPGKLLLGLAIANPDASPAARAVLSLRWSTKYFCLLCAFLFVLTDFVLFRLVGGLSQTLVAIGFLFASCDHHQSWHDQWSRTAVFRRRDLQRPPHP